jgi:tetratricopeptide (TPR) repeat protein
MDAKTLYRQGITAIRDQGDLQRGRELLLQSLRLDSQNDMAWLWLTRTVRDRQKQLEYVERALSINPNNESAQQLRLRLQVASP